MSDPSRTYDIILFGATGFTGGLTAEYLARHASARGIRWAIAGRDADKLHALAQRLERIDPACMALGVIEADIHDPGALHRMAEQGHVLITTVGPYIDYGEPVLAACIDAGTHYLDLTGEPEFVDRMIARYDAVARDKGLRIVNSCGFDSIPHDLGALQARQLLPADQPVTLEAFVRGGGRLSGGTLNSALTAMSRARQYLAQRRELREALARYDDPERAIKPLLRPIRYHRRWRSWSCPLPTIDPEVVLRSAKGRSDYGPAFRYGHHALVRHLPVLLGGLGGVAGLAVATQVPPLRELLFRLAPQPGQGPSDARRAASFFEVFFRGRAADGSTVETRVSGGDPGYGETSKMIAEAAMCLITDHARLQHQAGVITPALAFGEPLIDRLQAAGIRFEVLSLATTQREAA